jgi:hypothetical protein
MKDPTFADDLVKDIRSRHKGRKAQKFALAFYISKLNPFDPFGVMSKNAYIEAGKKMRFYKKSTRPIRIKK